MSSNQGPREIRTRADADSIRADIEDVYDGWFANDPHVDSEEFLDRLERYGYDLGDVLNTAAIRRIGQIIRELRKAAE